MPPPAGRSRQLPSGLVRPEFGEVNVRPDGRTQHVSLTILIEPTRADGQGWQTGVALDASASMRSSYGRTLTGSVPPDVMDDYRRKGWVVRKEIDGRSVESMTREGHDAAKSRGYLRDGDNVMEPIARSFVAHLAGGLDDDGGTTLIYWACGDGGELEVVGDVTEAECPTLKVAGPLKAAFGKGTRLWPAVRYFLDRFRDAERGIYLFVTDGRLDDLDEVKHQSTWLARDVATGRRKPVKLVLIGLGEAIDAGQMEELDDLDTGTDVDLWDHKIAAEMRSLGEIFAEVVTESTLVAPAGEVFDPAGQSAKKFPNGLPAKIEFDLPADAAWFELDVGGTRLRQPLHA